MLSSFLMLTYSVFSGVRHPVRVVLLAGSDLIQTMSEPGVWSSRDVCRLPMLRRPFLS